MKHATEKDSAALDLSQCRAAAPFFGLFFLFPDAVFIPQAHRGNASRPNKNPTISRKRCDEPPDVADARSWTFFTRPHEEAASHTQRSWRRCCPFRSSNQYTQAWLFFDTDGTLQFALNEIERERPDARRSCQRVDREKGGSENTVVLKKKNGLPQTAVGQGRPPDPFPSS